MNRHSSVESYQTTSKPVSEVAPGSVWAMPADGPDDVRHRGGAILFQALALNCGNLRRRCQAKGPSPIGEADSSEAPPPRKAVDKYGRVYVNFSPAVGRDALKAMRQTIRGWHLQLKSDKGLDDLSAMFAPILKGWQQYFGRFHGSALKPVWRSMNLFLIRWLMRKHKRLAGRKTRAAEMLKRLAQSQPGTFIHWSLGILS